MQNAVLLRLPVELKQEIQRLARQNDRTTTGEIRAALRAYSRASARDLRSSQEPAGVSSSD